jgi:DNA transformation protein
MARESEFLNEVIGRLAPIGARGRSMFGGFGVYVDDVMMALVADDVVYFKTDDSNRADYEDRGSAPFMYSGKRGQPIAMSYHEVPDEVFDDVDDLILWAEKALAVAKRNKKTKKKR